MTQRIIELGSAFFFPAVLFFLLPASIILANQAEFEVQFSTVAAFAIAFGVSGIATFALILRGSQGSTLAIQTFRFLTAVGLSVFLWDQASLYLTAQPIGMVVAVDTLILLLAFIACWRVDLQNLKVISSVFMTTLCTLLVIQNLGAIVKTPEESAKNSPIQQHVLPELSAKSFLAVGGGQVALSEQGAAIHTGSSKFSYAAWMQIPIAAPLEKNAVLTAKVETTSGKISLGLMPEDQSRWLEGSAIVSYPSSEKISIPVKAGEQPGWLVLANAYDEEGISSEAIVSELSLDYVDSDYSETRPGNVYHVVLDAYQSQAYSLFKNESPFTSNGTYFPNFRSGAGRTWQSMAELFSASRYTSDDTPENWFNRAFRSGFPNRLAQAGIDVHMYVHYRDYCFALASTCFSDFDHPGKDPSLLVLDLWFLRAIPTSLERLLNKLNWGQKTAVEAQQEWDIGFSISETIWGGSQSPQPVDIPFHSVQTFLKLLEDETTRSSDGNYVFAHLILPHPPHVVDESCDFLPPKRRSSDRTLGYLKQVECSNKLIDELIYKLKELDRFDDSLLIVHSDHGNYYFTSQVEAMEMDKAHEHTDNSPFNVDLDPSNEWPEEMIETRSQALLWAKHKKQRTYEVSNQAFQTVDIAPMILSFWELATHDRNQLRTRKGQVFHATSMKPTPLNPSVVSEYIWDDRWVHERDIQSRR